MYGSGKEGSGGLYSTMAFVSFGSFVFVLGRQNCCSLAMD
jgi:hypothetical protein